jgi:cytochrome oxidase Cu insertion factor (SCO1/SenC/PrrC family)
MSTSESQLRSRNLRTLAMLAGLFLLPLAAAFWMYYGTGWRPSGHANHGELIIPVRPLPAPGLQPARDAGGTAVMAGDTVPADLFHGKWSLVYIGGGQCEASCRTALYVMRQTRLLLNKDMTRVARIFLVTSDCCATELLAHEHPGLLVLDAAQSQTAVLLRSFPAEARAESVFVVDPLGNLMMRFDVRQDPKGLLADLKKLLSLSHIG